MIMARRHLVQDGLQNLCNGTYQRGNFGCRLYEDVNDREVVIVDGFQSKKRTGD